MFLKLKTPCFFLRVFGKKEVNNWDFVSYFFKKSAEQSCLGIPDVFIDTLKWLKRFSINWSYFGLVTSHRWIHNPDLAIYVFSFKLVSRVIYPGLPIIMGPPDGERDPYYSHMCQGLNSHYFHIIGDGHQPNSRGLYIHYKDSLLKVG